MKIGWGPKRAGGSNVSQLSLPPCDTLEYHLTTITIVLVKRKQCVVILILYLYLKYIYNKYYFKGTSLNYQSEAIHFPFTLLQHIVSFHYFPCLICLHQDSTS